jgi:serine/threonine protein kinase
VWELVDGPDLLDLLNEHRGRMREDLAARYLLDVMQAVQFLHDHNFCHRDLKPENAVLKRRSGRVKLIGEIYGRHLPARTAFSDPLSEA